MAFEIKKKDSSEVIEPEVEVMDDGFYAYETEEAYALSGAMPNGAVMSYADYVDFNTEEYKYTPENVWQSPVSSPFSTFAADVDTASYAQLRALILAGKPVPRDAVRIEEMLNYFKYDYIVPEGDEVVAVYAYCNLHSLWKA